MEDRRSLIAEKALTILEIPHTVDPLAKLREIASLGTTRADIRFSRKIVQLLEEGKAEEAEKLLPALEGWHQWCVGG